uniref:Cyclin-dependent kinases regulatory subunit n=1 Tax=Macrostomum lignano TaxID=282301 RepID=A0A1I8IND3_9PLAT
MAGLPDSHPAQQLQQRPDCQLPNSPSNDSRVFYEICSLAACPKAAEEDIGRRGGGGCSIGASGLPGLKHHALMKGVSGIVMEQHESLRLKRSRGGSSNGGATPSGMSPGGIPSQTAASATAAPASAVVAAAAGGAGRARHQQQQKASRCHFTFDFREPDQMEEFRAQRLQRKFREKLGAKSAKYELVAGFHLDEGVIVSYHPFRTRVHFELTERRRKILARYYRRGQQEVLLYVDRSEFEYYTPVCCCQPLNSPTGDSKRDGKRHSGKDNSSTSCFAIAGCAS